MAISLLKRYRNEINYIISKISFSFYGSGDCSIKVCDSFSLPGISNLSYNMSSRKETFPISELINGDVFDFKKHNKIVEQGDLIYIGINLEDIKLSDLKGYSKFYKGKEFFKLGLDREDSYSIGIFYYDFISYINLSDDKDMLFLKSVVPENDFPNLYSSIKDFLDYGETRIDIDNSKFTYFLKALKDYVKDGSLKRTHMFDTIKKNVNKNLNKPFKVGVCEGCYKTLKDRQILPYVIYSPIGNIVKYQRNCYFYNEKKGVERVDIDSLSKCEAYAPWGLIERLED